MFISQVLLDFRLRSPLHSVVNIQISSTSRTGRMINLSAIVVPKVTCDLPLSLIPSDSSSNLSLANPNYGKPGQTMESLVEWISCMVDSFVDVLLHGRHTGPPGSPVALETEFSWVLRDSTGSSDQVSLHIAAFHILTLSRNDSFGK